MTLTGERAKDHWSSVIGAFAACECEINGQPVPFNDGVAHAIDRLKDTHESGGFIWLIGNGGSGAVADHIACDMLLTRGWRAMALTNPALSTTMANDFGQKFMFAKQLEALARDGDAVIGMSCSGESENVIEAMCDPRLRRIALTGFRSANRLRLVGAEVDFWVPADDYGAVQIAHLTILHGIIDL